MKRDKIYIAELKYYEAGKGIEVHKPLSLVLVGQTEENKYINIFNPEEEYPTFRGSNYYSTYKDDDVIGRKYVCIGNKLETGPCWVLRGNLSKQCFKEDVEYNELEEYILKSSAYYKDRRSILSSRMKRELDLFITPKLIELDIIRESELKDYFESKKEEKPKSKVK